jgi:energy-coupling factor transporter ATP-binding protein EcfA2
MEIEQKDVTAVTYSKNGFMDQFDIEGYRFAAKEKHFTSKYFFLNSHNGLRRGKLHMFLAPSGSGKTTLTKSLLIDFLRNNPEKKVALYLTEETTEEFKLELSRAETNQEFKRLFIFSEEDDDTPHITSPKEMLNVLEGFMSEVKPDIIIIDNLTTSAVYDDLKPAHQGLLVKRIKQGVRSHNVAGVVFAHTGGEVDNSKKMLLRPNDVRGSKHIVMESHFLYVVQKVDCTGATGMAVSYTFIKMHKHRGQDVDFKLFSFKYNKKEMIYESDCMMDFEHLKNLFDKRDTL